MKQFLKHKRIPSIPAALQLVMDGLKLQPANPSIAPIVVNPSELRIQGVVTGLIRVYD